MKKTRRSFLIIILILVVVLVSGEESSPGGEYVIGLAYPFFMDEEIAFSDGVELAVDEVNANGGIDGIELRIIKMDDKGTVADGMKAAYSFVNNDEILAVIGHFNSRVALVTSRIYDREGIVYIASCATSPDLMKPGFDSVFRTIPDDRKAMEHTLRFLKEQGYQSLAIYYADDEFGEGVADSVERICPENGIEVVDRTTTINRGNLLKVLERWKAFDNRALLVAETFEKARDVIRMIKKSDPELLIVGTSALDYPEYIAYLDKAAEGTIIPTHYKLKRSTTLNRHFVDAFRNRYAKDPDMYAAIAYDTIMILKEAIENVDDPTPEALRSALHETKGFNGVTGTLSCDENGEFVGDNIFIKFVSDGQFIFLDD